MHRSDDALATAAARNHADWCELIAQSGRIPTTRTDDLWAADVPMPLGYGDVVLLRPNATADWGAIRGAHVGLSVVDSFADHDLTEYGFELALEGQWLALDEVGDAAEVAWQRVSPERFPDWLAEHGSLNDLDPSILDVAEVAVLESVVAGRFVAGAVLHSSDGVIGLNSVFLGDGNPAQAWRSLAGLAHTRFGHAPVVGYEAGDAVGPAIEAGFRVVGPMRVWAHLEVNEPA